MKKIVSLIGLLAAFTQTLTAECRYILDTPFVYDTPNWPGYAYANTCGSGKVIVGAGYMGTVPRSFKVRIYERGCLGTQVTIRETQFTNVTAGGDSECVDVDGPRSQITAIVFSTDGVGPIIGTGTWEEDH